MAIEAPINVSPDNETVYIDKTLEDPTQPWSASNEYVNPMKVKFTFNGDNLSWYRAEFYDNITGEILGYSHAPLDRIPWTGKYRNGDEVKIDSNVATNLFYNGNDYKYRFILYQADSNNEPLCDMLCVTGRVVSASGTSITVEKGITDIDDPYTAEDAQHNVYTIGYCMIEVVSDNSGAGYRNKIKINDYDKSTGVITLDSAFVGSIAAGTRYKIYRNYYKSPCYYVKCRDLASITPSIAVNAETGGVELSAVWSIASEKEVSLQKYQWEIDGYKGKEIYSYHDKNALPDRASDDLTLDAVFPFLANDAILATVTTTSQDGYTQTASATLQNHIARDNNMCTPITETNNAEYRNVYTNGIAMLLDQNRVAVKATAAEGYDNFKLWKRKGSTGHYRYVAECTLTDNIIKGYDNAAEDGFEYEYALSGEKNGSIKYKVIGSIIPDYKDRAVILKLKRREDYFGLTRFRKADTFIFDFELSKPSISINDGQAVINTGGKPIVIKESGRYLSGDFSAAITQMEVNGYSYDLKDSNETFEKALDFFDDSEYLLKIPDRGCIVAKITNKSLKKNEAGATILSFNFTQVAEADEVIV